MITVWGRRNSLNVQKVLWALGELDLPFERHNVGGSFGGNDTADFKALNPNGLVPVIRDGDIVMFESNAIVRYLGARYGHNGLKPKDAAGLAASEQWMDWTQLTLGPPAMALFMQRVRTAPEKQNPAAIENAIGQLKKVMPVVDQALAASPYLGGDELTFGDIPLGVYQWRLNAFDWPRPALPNLQRWFERLQDRAAFRKWVMIPVGRSPEEWLANEKALA